MIAKINQSALINHFYTAKKWEKMPNRDNLALANRVLG